MGRLTFTEEKDVEFANGPLTWPSIPGEDVGLFLRGRLPQLQGFLVTRGAGGSPRAWPQLVGSRAAAAVWRQVQELIAEPQLRQGPCLRLAVEPGRTEVGRRWPCPNPVVTPGGEAGRPARRGLSRAEAGQGLGRGRPPLPRLGCVPWRSPWSAACAHSTEDLPPWRWSHRCTLPPVCPPLPTPPGPFQNPSAFMSRTAEQSAKGASGCQFPDFYQISLGTAGSVSPGAGLSLPSGSGGIRKSSWPGEGQTG